MKILVPGTACFIDICTTPRPQDFIGVPEGTIGKRVEMHLSIQQLDRPPKYSDTASFGYWLVFSARKLRNLSRHSIFFLSLAGRSRQVKHCPLALVPACR
jgi:hypothetical protein